MDEVAELHRGYVTVHGLSGNGCRIPAKAGKAGRLVFKGIYPEFAFITRPGLVIPVWWLCLLSVRQSLSKKDSQAEPGNQAPCKLLHRGITYENIYLLSLSQYF